MSQPRPPSTPGVPTPPPQQDFDAVIRARQQEAQSARVGGVVQPTGYVRSPSLRTTPVRPPSTGYVRPPSVRVGQPYYTAPPVAVAPCPDAGCDPNCVETSEIMDCAHMDPTEGGYEDTLAVQRLPLQIIAAITMAFSVVELGIGGYAWDLTDHSFSYAQYGVTGAAAGAWWCGLAGIVAGIIGVVAIDKDWFIATCALSSAACAISIAGAVVDGIYATWHLSIRSCVNWNGDGGISTATTSTSTTWWFPPISGTSGSISQGWQYSGQALYATDALYCYTSLSGNANRVVQLTGTQTITSAALQLISGYISLARTGVSTSGSVFPTMSSVTTALTAGTNVLAGPLYWLFVGSINGLQSNDDPNFTPPTNKQCFCKSFDSRTLVSGFQPGTVATGNVVSTYPRAPTTGTTVLNTVTLANSFNAYDNCWQINAGARYGCNNVFADGYNYFATSCAFCVFVAALTATMAIFSGMAFSWHPPRQTDPEQPVGIAGGSVNY